MLIIFFRVRVLGTEFGCSVDGVVTKYAELTGTAQFRHLTAFKLSSA